MTGGPFRVALTFDAEHPDRPTAPGGSEALIEALSRLGITATFFIQGRWAEAYPQSARRIRDDGHLIGSHSHYHVRMPLLSARGLRSDIAAAESVIRLTTGVDPKPWFRCPFGAGARDQRVQAIVREAGYRHAGWHVIGHDWPPTRSAAQVEETVVTGAIEHGDGAVVLLHSWPDRTVGAIDGIATRLRDHGATFVRLDALGSVPSVGGEVDELAADGPTADGLEAAELAVADLATPGVTPAAVLAVDGGNSKADIALVGADGSLLGFRHGPTISHQQVGLETGMRRLVSLATDAAGAAGLATDLPLADVGAYGLAGADYPAEVRTLERGIERTGVAHRTVVRNDTFAALRAGATRPWGVVLICGHGINGAAIGRDGREVRFDAVGDISGDWGGGHAVGQAGLAAAVRADDGRGPKTALEDRVATFFGRSTIGAVVRDLYYGRIDEERLDQLSPLVFETAGEGDVAARAIVDRLADELVAMAGALIRRTRLGRAAPEVVLAGGVFRTREPAFYARLESGVRRAAPRATFVRLEAPPVLGAALIGLEALGLSEERLAAAEARLRSAFARPAGAPTKAGRR